MTDRATEQIEQALLGGPRRYTKAEAAGAAGVSLDRSQRIWLALGFAEVDDGARVFTDGDIAALRRWDALIASGAIDPRPLLSAPLPLDQFGEALHRVRTGQGIKWHIRPS